MQTILAQNLLTREAVRVLDAAHEVSDSHVNSLIDGNDTVESEDLRETPQVHIFFIVAHVVKVDPVELLLYLALFLDYLDYFVVDEIEKHGLNTEAQVPDEQRQVQQDHPLVEQLCLILGHYLRIRY